MYIRNLAIRRFKSVYELELGPLNHRLNVFIGKNGSGKSNILNVVRTLKENFEGATFDPFNIFFNKGMQPDPEFGFSITMSLNDTDIQELIQSSDMEAVLSDKEKERLGMRIKTLTYDIRLDGNRFFVWNIRSKDGLHILDNKTKGISNETLVAFSANKCPDELKLEDGIVTTFTQGLIDILEDYFRRAFIYDPHTVLKGELDQVLDEFINYQGITEGILFPKHGEESLEGKVLTECQKLVPTLEKIFVEPSGDNGKHVRFLLNGTDHTTGEVSEGTRKVLTLVMRLYDPDCSIVVADSPENNIFPETQSELFDIMKRSLKQVMLATHSIEFISHEPAVNVYKVVRRGHNQSTQVEEVEGVISDVTKLSGTRVFFLDRILLVEGPTDKVVIERYMNMLGFKDMEVAIIPCLGETNFKFFANIVNIQMLGVPLSKVQILTDGDNRKDKAQYIRKAINRHYDDEDFVGTNGIGIHILPRFSIENYLEPRQIVKVLKEGHGMEVTNQLRKRLRSNNPTMDIKSDVLIHVFKVRKHELKGMTSLYKEVLERMNKGNTHPKRLNEMDILLRRMLGLPPPDQG